MTDEYFTIMEEEYYENLLLEEDIETKLFDSDGIEII